MITAGQVKELRDKTGVSVMQCKKALEEAGGDSGEALEILKKKGSEIASKKADRALNSGYIASYIHGNGAIGVLVELLCETDFVAKNKEFQTLAEDIAMHIAAMDPKQVKEDGILESERENAEKEQTLLDQPFIKEPQMTVQDIIERAVQKIGERITIGRFVRYSLHK